MKAVYGNRNYDPLVRDKRTIRSCNVLYATI